MDFWVVVQDVYVFRMHARWRDTLVNITSAVHPLDFYDNNEPMVAK